VFAYGVLGLFGLSCPPLRSSELWEDSVATVAVERPRPLDLVLFNATEDPFGAHLGVWMAPTKSSTFARKSEVRVPIVWPMAGFSRRARYATTVGFKRVLGTELADRADL
jgi:hypothetical protein